MSMVLTRSPLQSIGMNGAGTSKRRSARLSHEGAEENEPPMKRSRVNGAQSTAVSTKEQDGDANAMGKRKPRKAYDEEIDGFAFTKGGRKAKQPKQPAVRNSTEELRPAAAEAPVSAKESVKQKMPSAIPQAPVPAPLTDDVAPKAAQKKARRRFPTTPERDAADKGARRSKRLSSEHVSPDPQPSPSRSAHARSHANVERSPSPEKARPVTVEKKRKRGANGGEEEEKIMRIALPFQDTPVIKRNKEMRKGPGDGARRSSSGMRGRRASSLIDEGRGNGTYTAFPGAAYPGCTLMHLPMATSSMQDTHFARVESYEQLKVAVFGSTTLVQNDSAAPTQPPLFKEVQEVFADESPPAIAIPHAEVSTAEFYKHISAELTEPRRMRCLLGWCGTRTLPPKPDAPKDSSPASSLEFQALQAARVIQDELSQDLVTRGVLSDWFSRDETVPPRVPLRRKPNPRNIANAAKAEELERELERLKNERASWDTLMQSAVPSSPPTGSGADSNEDVLLSPPHPELLDSPQRAILAELQAPSATTSTSNSIPTDAAALQQRLRSVASDLEFSVDQFTHGVHALATSRQTAERLAERTLGEAASVLGEREQVRKVEGKGTDAMDALKALGKVLNGGGRRRG